MTDEEKTEEYVNSKGFGSDYNNIDSNEANEKIRQAYLDGLAEGRKENSKNIKKIQEFRKIDQKQILEQMDEIEQPKKEIAELKAQIEKMKFDVKVEAERNAYISQATLNHLIEQWEESK